jgi:hypothetical protein
MSVQRPQHDETTRDAFETILGIILENQSKPTPATRKYKAIDGASHGETAKVTIHNDAWKNSPHDTGDELLEYYFQEAGIVIIDLNPQRD